MNRSRLSLVVLGTLIVAGFAAFGLPRLHSVPAAWAENAKLSQLNTPGSTTEKKPTATPTSPSTQAAPSAGAAKPQAAGPGWAVNCKSGAKEKELECRMSQTVVLKQSGQVLTNVAFRIPTDTKKLEIIVQLPLGMLLPAGATVQVDENPPQRLNIRACDRSGCFAQAPIAPETLALLRKGKQLKVGFQNLAEKQITIPLSLDGFGDAYEKMQRSS